MTDQKMIIEQMSKAAFAGDVDQLRSLLEHDPSLATATMTQENGQPIHLASCASLEAVKLLLEYGADPLVASNDGNALHLAVWYDKSDIVAHLLDCGVDPNATAPAGETPLHFAALKGLDAIGRLLLERGANPNARTTHGSTDMFNTSPPVVGESPLHLAAAYGHASFVRLLLEHGADKQITDHIGQTPMHWAARHDQSDIIRMLR